MDIDRIAYLMAEHEAERLSYGEYAEIDDAFEQIDPATLRDLPENAMAGDKLEELLERAARPDHRRFSAEHGIWSDCAGGFIELQIYTPTDADEAIARFVADGEDRDDLRILEVCQDHRDEEQPRHGCDLCNREEG